MQNTMPSTFSRGLSDSLDHPDRAGQRAQPLEREVLGLHRDQHRIGGDQRVERQQPERRRAVEDDVVPRQRRRLLERPRQHRLAAQHADQLDLRAGEVLRGRHDLQRRQLGRLDHLLQLRPAEQQVVAAARLDLPAALADRRARVALRIEVDEQHPLLGHRQAGREVDRRRGLALAALFGC
jgi:hypothetical protein